MKVSLKEVELLAHPFLVQSVVQLRYTVQSGASPATVALLA